MSLKPGARLGRYQVLRPLAIGGMAEVYLECAAGIEGFKKRVVIKRILPQFSVNAEFVNMFLNEARLTAMLDHPNIVQVHDIGDQGGSYYLSMEYIRGQDVRGILRRARLRQEQMPLACVVGIGIGAAAGLHYAHDASDHTGAPLDLIHRDVSLSNVLVSYDGGVKLVDFGIAKAAASNVETRTGTLKGKLSYMSPEQCAGDVLDRRSDIFAMGVVLFEMATGTRLFAGANELAILQMIANEDAEAPSTRRAEIPPELDRIILKALRRDRDERYDSALELQRDLHQFACSQGLSTSAFALAEYMGSSFADDIASEPSDSSLRKILAAADAAPPSIQIDMEDVAGQGEDPVALSTSMFEVDMDSSDLLSGAAIEMTADSPSRSVRRWRAVGGAALGLVALAAFLLWPREVQKASALAPELRSPKTIDPEPTASADELATTTMAEDPPIGPAIEESVTSPPAAEAIAIAAQATEEIVPPSAELAIDEPRTKPAGTRAHRRKARGQPTKQASAAHKAQAPHEVLAPRDQETTWNTNSALLPSL